MSRSMGYVACLFMALPIWMVCGLPVAAHGQTKSTTSNVTGSTKEESKSLADNERKWKKLEPVIAKYQKLRSQTTIEVAESLANTLIKLDARIDGRKFAQEVLSLENAIQATGNKAQIRAFVQKSFDKHVINVAEIEKLLHLFLTEHDKKMAEIDNQFLIECELDVEFDASAIRTSRVQLDGVKQEFAKVAANLEQTVTQAFTHHLLTGATSLAAVEVGSMIGNELGRDANGNTTMDGQILGFLFGVAAGVAAEEMASSALGTEKDIADKATASARSILRTQLLQIPNVEPAWIATMRETAAVHDRLCMNSLVYVLGPKPEPAASAEK